MESEVKVANSYVLCLKSYFSKVNDCVFEFCKILNNNQLFKLPEELRVPSQNCQRPITAYNRDRAFC